MTSSFIMKRVVTAGLVAAVSMGLLAGTAIAGETDVLSDVTKAAQLQGAAPATETLAVTKLGSQVITETGSLKLAIPAGSITNTASGAIVDGAGDSQIVFQKVDDDSYRASIHIASADAPESYEFNVRGASKLVPQPDGSITAVDSTGEFVASIEAPWAKDAKGKSVATHYEIDGMTLTQTVDTKSEGTSFPVVADPRLSVKIGHTWAHLSKEETKYVVGKFGVGGGAAAGAAAGGVIGGVIGAAVGAMAGDILNDVLARFAKNKCLSIKISHPIPFVQGMGISGAKLRNC